MDSELQAMPALGRVKVLLLQHGITALIQHAYAQARLMLTHVECATRGEALVEREEKGQLASRWHTTDCGLISSYLLPRV